MITFVGSETLLQISKYCISNAKINEFVMKKENEILSFIFYDIFTVKDGSRWHRFIFFCIRSWVILFSFSYFRTHNEIELKIDTNKERERKRNKVVHEETIVIWRMWFYYIFTIIFLTVRKEVYLNNIFDKISPLNFGPIGKYFAEKK